MCELPTESVMLWDEPVELGLGRSRTDGSLQSDPDISKRSE